MFSHRSGRSRAPNALAQLLAESPAPRFDLCGSNPTRVGIAYPEALLRGLARAAEAAHVYEPTPFGTVTAREAVARHFAESRKLEPPAVDEILLSASTSEAYSFLFKLLCDPGDEVLVPAPSYPLFEHLAELEAVRAVPYRLAYDGAWHIDFDSLRRARSARTRAVLSVSPNNPTGHYVRSVEYAALQELGLPIVSDEVFFEYPLAAQPAGALEIYRERPQTLAFSLGGLSKLAGAPQLKLAWTLIFGPEAQRREARERLELIADTFLSVSTPVQQALPEILRASPDVTRAIGERCRGNLTLLARATLDSPVTLLRAEGGWSAVLQLPNVTSEDEFVAGLLREQGVLVQPGWFYDFEREPFVVVSLLGEPELFEAGCERLVQHAARLAT